MLPVVRAQWRMVSQLLEAHALGTGCGETGGQLGKADAAWKYELGGASTSYLLPDVSFTFDCFSLSIKHILLGIVREGGCVQA